MYSYDFICTYKLLKDYKDNDIDPNERKADLDAMRLDMYNTIGYDYRTDQLTPEILNQLK